MPAFRFRLERALDWRREQREIEESGLARCVTALERSLARIAHLEAERQAIDRELVGRSSIPASDLAALSRYRLGAAQLAVSLEQERAQRRIDADRQRAKVQAARRKVSLLEKLRERRLAEHVQAEERELENSAAESFLARWTGQAAR
jgi:flagellar export protein FliJ